ncbi:MFS transporter, partial [Streptomyces sp. NPDC059233]
MGPEEARAIVDASDTRLDMAGAWAVMQVDLMTRTVGHAGLGLIAGRRSLPPEVLLPVFERMVDEGYLTRQNGFFSLTPAGEREAGVISAAWAEWLKDRLEQDRGRPRSAELRVAADAIAKRLLAEDLGEGNFAPRVVMRG